MDNEKIYRKALALEPLTAGEAMRLYDTAPTGELTLLAWELRQKQVPGDVVTWQIDRNVNITNVCISGCKFCNFHCKPHQTERAYVTTIEQYAQKIEETLALGGDQLLLQGGLHPKLGIDFYENLFRELKTRYPQIRLHALGAPEVFHIARISGLDTETTLRRLVDAGLDSLPGAGAEILDNGVRRAVSPGKPNADQWLDVMRTAHRLGLATSATMMYGHVETPRQRIEHLIRIRDLQAECPAGNYGFIAFIPWIFRASRTRGRKRPVRSARIPTDHRDQPHRPAQHPQYTGFVADGRQSDRANGAARRRQRYGIDHDRRKRRLVGRRAQSFRRAGYPAGDPRGGLRAAPAQPVIRIPGRTVRIGTPGTGQVILYTGLFRNIPTIPPRFSTIFARTVSKPSLITKTQNDETGKCRGAKPRCSETDRNA